jgi:D-arabinose 1-dehydrogenase
MTKCGRYGNSLGSFDYSPKTIRSSVKTSMSRLKTTYLDTVYLHDVEFMCTPVGPKSTGNPSVALREGGESGGDDFGLAEGDEGKVWGEGDQAVLDAIAELRKMQDEGLILNVGISGE